MDCNGLKDISEMYLRISKTQVEKLLAVNSKFDSFVGLLINPAKGIINGLHF
jgi:hypothetical protein